MFKERFLRLNAALLEEWLRSLAGKLHELIPGSPVVGFILFHNKGVYMATIEVSADSLPLNATVKFLDSEGNETPADDVPRWLSSDEAVATLTVAADGLSASAAIGGPGASQIEVRSTETNTGVEVVAAGTITVLPGDAVVGDVTFEVSTPVPTEPPVEG